MDNCYLKKLFTKPGKLSPKFHKDNFNYNIILGVSELKTTLDFCAEESGASYQIYVEGGDGGKTISVDEGKCKVVKIEVTAEDGKSVKCYFVEIKRHSSKAAIIESLKINNGSLEPEFKSGIFEYLAFVGLKTVNVEFSIEVPDTKSKVLINNDEVKPSYTLTFGCTSFNINVTSPDGSNKQMYKLKMLKKANPYFILITDPLLRLLYEDPISLSPCFYPCKTKSLYSWDILAKSEAEHLVNLNKNDFQSALELDDSIEQFISNLEGQCLKSNLELLDSVKLSNLGTMLSSSNDGRNLAEISYSFYPFNENINISPEWQQSLSIPDNTETDKVLLKKCEEAISLYLQSRPLNPIFDKNQSINHEHPSKRLFNAISLAATITNVKKSESQHHFRLAQLLEENYLNEDIFNLILQKTNGGIDNQKAVDSASRNNKAVITAKQDEILAICKLHGYSNNPTDTEQLMALDKEYHSLIAQNQSARADAIQNLYEWKSKQTSQESSMSCQASNVETPFGQAFNKYLAALSLDKKSYVYNFHVGRLLIIQGKYKEAVERLHTSLNSKNTHLPSQLCLGLAMSFVPEIIKDRINQAIFLISDALSSGMSGILNNANETNIENVNNHKLLADDENFFHIKNPLISKAILQLGTMLMKKSQNKITTKPSVIIHWALHLATQGWAQIGIGNNLIQFEYIIIECHRLLILLLHEEMDSPSDLVYINRCLWLINFIKSSTVVINGETLKLLEEISKVPLFFEPGNAYFLTNYGEMLYRKADQMTSNDETFLSAIQSTIKVLHYALDVKRENKVEDAIKYIKEQQWYKNKSLIINQWKPSDDKNKSSDKKVAEATKPSPAPPATKTATAKPPINAAKKPPPASVKKGPTKPVNATSKSAVTEKEIDKMKPEMKEDSVKSTANAENANIKYNRIISNGTTKDLYITERALARSYRINKQYHESVKYFKISGIDKYLTTINDVMQEYIEILVLAEDYETALKVYYKLPISESNPSFDDGYICGEIVGLLMKLEKYNDPMLVKYASLWAKIFGFSIIDKEIKILESKNNTETCKKIYAAVHGKKVDDPDLKMFFQLRCWI